MSSTDGRRLLGDSPGAEFTLQHNLEAINHVRTLLAQSDVIEFSQLIAAFSNLVDDCGPLGFLRFDAVAFDHIVRQHLGEMTQFSDAEVFCDQMHRACIDALATPASLDHFQGELRVFLKQPYVPHEDRLSACAALLTLGRPSDETVSMCELPALYALFRVQLIAWLMEAGAQQRALSHMADALVDS